MATAPPGDREPLAELIAALDDADDGAGLPVGVVHPDPVLANVVAAPGPGMVLVDWAGAGIGPRVWPLAFLLWAEGVKDLRRVDLVAAGYRRVLGREPGPGGALEPEELERLAGLIPARHLVFTALSVARGRLRPAAAVQSVRTEVGRAEDRRSCAPGLHCSAVSASRRPELTPATARLLVSAPWHSHSCRTPSSASSTSSRSRSAPTGSSP